MKNDRRVTLHDKEFEIFIHSSEIQQIVSALAEQINKDYQDHNLIILSILNGSFIFAADLVRHFDFPLTMEFVRYSSYDGTSTTGNVTKILDIKSDIEGRDILILEDIVDTGLTLSHALEDLRVKRPKSIAIASLLVKPEALQHNLHVHYIGKKIANDFVVGYGLDYNELGRDLAHIYRLVK